MSPRPSTHDLRFPLKQSKCGLLRPRCHLFPEEFHQVAGRHVLFVSNVSFCRWREEWRIKLLKPMKSTGQVRPTECPVTPLVRGRQAAPEITAHEPLDVPHPLLHHHVRVNTLHKSIGQNIGRQIMFKTWSLRRTRLGMAKSKAEI